MITSETIAENLDSIKKLIKEYHAASLYIFRDMIGQRDLPLGDHVSFFVTPEPAMSTSDLVELKTELTLLLESTVGLYTKIILQNHITQKIITAEQYDNILSKKVELEEWVVNIQKKSAVVPAIL